MGSIDELMETNDTFAKYDAQIEQSLKRNEAVYMAVCRELEPGIKDADIKFRIDMKVRKEDGTMTTIKKPVAEYVNEFVWDATRFPMDKSLKVLGTKCISTQRSSDEKLKKVQDK